MYEYIETHWSIRNKKIALSCYLEQELVDLLNEDSQKYDTSISKILRSAVLYWFWQKGKVKDIKIAVNLPNGGFLNTGCISPREYLRILYAMEKDVKPTAVKSEFVASSSFNYIYNANFGIILLVRMNT